MTFTSTFIGQTTVPPLRIGQLSERAGVTPRTVRYYESIGLLPTGAREGAQRAYADATILRLKKIEQLKSLGLSLEEIASVIDLYEEDPTGRQAKTGVLAILRRHRDDATRKIGALQDFVADLEAHIARFELWFAAHPQASDPNGGTGHD